MSILANEYNETFNFALGTYALINYIQSYQNNSLNNSGSPALLSFIVVPIVLYQDTCEVVIGTNKFNKLVTKLEFENEKKAKPRNLLIELQYRAFNLRQTTFNSILCGISKGFFELNTLDGSFKFLSAPTSDHKNDQLKKIEKASNKLGKYFARKDLIDIATFLKVVF